MPTQPKIHLLAGHRVGRWTIVREAARRGKNGRQRYYLCQCACGSEVEVALSSLRAGISNGCQSCPIVHESVICPGEVWGKWTVVERAESRGYDSYYLCRCVCGSEREVGFQSLKKMKHLESCGGCRGRRRAVGDISANYWSRVLKNAQIRGYEVVLTHEEAWELYQNQEGSCALSGLEIPLRESASLDRIDSTKGYVPGNVQWIHKDINRMKNAFSEDYFVEMCVLISAYCSDSRYQVRF